MGGGKGERVTRKPRSGDVADSTSALQSYGTQVSNISKISNSKI
jgi:hypothetical protein